MNRYWELAMTKLPEMAVNINGNLGFKEWRDQPPTQNMTLEEKREAARRVNAYPKLIEAMKSECLERRAAAADASNPVRKAYEQSRAHFLGSLLADLGEYDQ